jgi:hypothetical protein
LLEEDEDEACDMMNDEDRKIFREGEAEKFIPPLPSCPHLLPPPNTRPSPCMVACSHTRYLSGVLSLSLKHVVFFQICPEHCKFLRSLFFLDM